MSDGSPLWTEAERQEVLTEALRVPESPEEQSSQQAKFHVWLSNPRYRHLWPMLQRLVSTPQFVEDAAPAISAILK